MWKFATFKSQQVVLRYKPSFVSVWFLWLGKQLDEERAYLVYRSMMAGGGGGTWRQELKF